jgi:hypothetical protein
MNDETNRIVIDESNYNVNIEITPNIKIVRFNNKDYKEVFKDKLFKLLESLENRQNIEVLNIEWSSSLDDLEIAKYFPTVKRLILSGKNLKNISGIEALQNLNELLIETEKNNRRKIHGIEKLGLSSLSVDYVLQSDLEIISKCTSIKFLHLQGSFDIDFKVFSQLSLLEEMSLVNRRIEEISNINCMKNLRTLDIAYCSNLTRFGENNENIEVLWLQSCNRLNLDSITQLKNLTRLVMMSQKNISDLDFLMNMHKLKNMSISGTNLNSTNLEALKSTNSLKYVWLSVNDKIIEDIAKSNRNLLISNGDINFKNGKQISDDEYQRLKS